MKCSKLINIIFHVSWLMLFQCCVASALTPNVEYQVDIPTGTSGIPGTSTNYPSIPAIPPYSDNATVQFLKASTVSNTTLTDIIPTSDGGSVATGNIRFTSSNGNDILITSYDSNGEVRWCRSFGGTGDDYGFSVIETSDKDILVAGSTSSFSDSSDIIILKLNSSGEVVWQKIFGGTGSDSVRAVVETADKGYMIAGHTDSFGADSNDMFLVKMNSSGTVTWAKYYSAPLSQYCRGMVQTVDGGFMLAGDSPSETDKNSLLLVKTSEDGTVQWQKAYKYSEHHLAHPMSVVQTNDRGFIVGGYSILGYSNQYGGFALKVDEDGAVQWGRLITGTDAETIDDIIRSVDGTYVLAGGTSDSSGRKGLLMKISNSGELTWQKKVSAGQALRFYTIGQDSDGSYLLGGDVHDKSCSSCQLLEYALTAKISRNGLLMGCSEMSETATDFDDITFESRASSAVAKTVSTMAHHDSGPFLRNLICSSNTYCYYGGLKTVTVKRQGNCSGTVVINDGQEDYTCSESPCSMQYEYGTTVTLTAQPENGCTAEPWSGSCGSCGSSRVCDLGELQEDANCTIIFNPINHAPTIASFSASPTSGEAPLEVNFSCIASDSDGTIDKYQWDFDNDGITDLQNTTPDTSTTYREPGTYRAIVRVLDNDNRAATSSTVTITVTEPHETAETSTPSEGSSSVESSGAEAGSEEEDTQGNSSSRIPVTSTYVLGIHARACSNSNNCTESALFHGGDHFVLDICIEGVPEDRNDPVDMYVAIAVPNSAIYFLLNNPLMPLKLYTGSDINPGYAYQRGMSQPGDCIRLMEFDVPQGLTGTFPVYGALNSAGTNISMFNLQSNIASKEITFEN